MFHIKHYSPNPKSPLQGRDIQFRIGVVADDSCSCGEAHAHPVARRHTYDGHLVEFWSDGMVTCGAMRMVIASGLTDDMRNCIVGNVDLYDLSEIPACIHETRRARLAVARA